MPAWVVDASVGLKLFIGEALSGEADLLFAALDSDPPARLYVPDLFYIECASVLWKHVTRFGYPAALARENLIKLRSLLLHSIPTAALLTEALEIALSQGITAYDACYVALAWKLRTPFITADEKLVHQLKGSPYQITWLGDLKSLPTPDLS